MEAGESNAKVLTVKGPVRTLYPASCHGGRQMGNSLRKTDMHEAGRLRKVILLPRIDSHNNSSVSMISEFIINLGAAVPMVSSAWKVFSLNPFHTGGLSYQHTDFGEHIQALVLKVAGRV